MVNLNLPSNPVDEFQISFPSTDLIEQLHRNISSLQNLTNKTCMQAYSNPLVSMRSNVLVVTSNVSVSNNVHAWSLVSADSSDPNPLAWMYTPYEAYSRNRCSADRALRTANDWHVFGEASSVLPQPTERAGMQITVQPDNHGHCYSVQHHKAGLPCLHYYTM